MSIFNKLFGNNRTNFSALNVADSDIVAMADGKMIDITSVPDPMFANKVMGDSVAFSFKGNKTVICAPANGELSVLFPTGHAFGITMENDVELLVHIGIDTVNANGEGFKICGHQQGDKIKAGEPLIEVNFDRLSKSYNMSTMLIVTNSNEQKIEFLSEENVTRGQKLIA